MFFLNRNRSIYWINSNFYLDISPLCLLRSAQNKHYMLKGVDNTMDNNEQRTQRLKKEGTLHPFPDKVCTDLIAKSRFFDANDLMQMKYEMLRSVSADQQSVVEAAQTFGLSRVAYYHAQKQYQQHGLAGLLPRRRGPKHPHKFTPEVMSFIDEHLAATDGRPDWNFLSKQIENRFGAKVHPRSVERAVKRKKGAEQ